MCHLHATLLRCLPQVAEYVGSNNANFLEVFAARNNYASLTQGWTLGDTVDVSHITLDEAIECANRSVNTPFELVGDVVRRLLRLKDGAPLIPRGGEAGEIPLITVVGLVYARAISL
jgi:hypothetical protein